MQVQSLQRRMLLGSAGAGRKESKSNIDIYRDICCQVIQDHVLIQPESHAEWSVLEKWYLALTEVDGK